MSNNAERDAGSEREASFERLLLFDGNNLLFRSFSALPKSIAAPDGEPVNGVYGLIASVLSLAREYSPGSVAFAWDTPGTPTFRHGLMQGYQGTRKQLADEAARNFAWQRRAAIEMLGILGIPSFQHAGFEADDIIATLSQVATARGFAVIIVSNDRDLMQLIDSRVHQRLPGKDRHELGPPEVSAKYGISPEQVPDWKVLAGDASDNVKGIRGVGRVTAVALLRRYGNLKAILEDTSSLPKRLATAIDLGRGDVDLLVQLVTLRRDVPVEFEPQFCDQSSWPSSAREALESHGLLSQNKSANGGIQLTLQ